MDGWSRIGFLRIRTLDIVQSDVRFVSRLENGFLFVLPVVGLPVLILGRVYSALT